MLWVVTFSVFLPSLTSSSVVCANPSTGQKAIRVANSQIFTMNGLPWLQPEFSICTAVTRILRFSRPRHKEFATEAGPEGPRDLGEPLVVTGNAARQHG